MALFFCSIIAAQNVGIGNTKPEAILHIDPKSNTTTSNPTSYYDDVAVTNQGQMGVGTKTPKTRVDMRSDENLNELAIGGSSQNAATAQAGALRYNTSTADLSYSDGTNWIVLAHQAPSDFVDATNSSTMTIKNAATTPISNWTSKTDVNNSFTPNTGIFTASKNGVYLVSFNYTLSSSVLSNDSRIEAIIQTNSTSSSTIKSFRCVNSYPGSNTTANRISGGCTGIFNLNANDQITVSLQNGLGSDKKLDSDNTLTSLNIFGI